MKNKEHAKTEVRLTENTSSTTQNTRQQNTVPKSNTLKKPLIFCLMGVAFIGCLYLIFKPSEDKKNIPNIGLIDIVPQATGAGMPADKSKAYEQEMLELKEQEKRNTIASLSDYWQTKDNETNNNQFLPDDNTYVDLERDLARNENASINSYQNAKTTLGSFYYEEQSETKELRRQIETLKEKLAEKDVPTVPTVDDQLKLMERSYEMAAKYLPQNTNNDIPRATKEITQSNNPTTITNKKEQFIAITPSRKNTVSNLFRAQTDSAFYADWLLIKNRGFNTATAIEQGKQHKNSIIACVHTEQTIIGESSVRLRLLEAAQTSEYTIPIGTVVVAHVKLQNGRLQLKINTIELDGNIISVDMTVYDTDGQQGLLVPYSPERSALTEMVGNMSQSAGTSVMLTQNAGQQAAADISRGVIQGISGYFSKKIKTPKITLKAGHQVYLVSKN